MRQMYPRPPSRDTAVARAILTRRVIAIPDVLEDADYVTDAHSLAGGFRSVLAMPLTWLGKAIGAIAVGRDEPGQFRDTQIDMLNTFADQSVFALEDVRLFRELSDRNRDIAEALEQQTATNEILAVMSESQTDVQPVFDAIATAALNLCRASSASVLHLRRRTRFTWPPSLQVNPGISRGSMRQMYPTTAEPRYRSRPGDPDAARDRDPGRARGRRLRDRCSLSGRGFPQRAGHASDMRVGKAIGAIAVAAPQPGPFTYTQIALLQTFADQDRHCDRERAAFRGTGSADRPADPVGRRTSRIGRYRAGGQFDAGPRDRALNDRAPGHRSSRTWTAAVSTNTTKSREVFHLHTAYRLPDDLVAALRATPIRKGEGALGLMALTGEPVQIVRHHGRGQLSEPRPGDSPAISATGDCWQCRSCPTAVCSVDWS